MNDKVFAHLRMKMTLITVSVIIFIFFVLSTSLYCSMSMKFTRDSYFIINRISEEVVGKSINDLPGLPERKDGGKRLRNSTLDFLFVPPKPTFFFAKLADSGEILFSSRGVTITDDRLSELCHKVAETGNEPQKVKFDNTTFAYQVTPLAEENGKLIVFNDLSTLNEQLSTLRNHLLATGLGCAMLAFLFSFFFVKQAIKPIRKSTEQQQNFVSDASHELRTPITIIQTNLDIIKGAEPEETVLQNKKWLDNIQDETTRMTELINTLLFLARADANHQLLEKEYFPLRPVLNDALNSFEVLAAKKQIILKLEAADDITALGDSIRLKQVMTILLDNALRHTDENGIVIVNAAQKNEQLVIMVRDNGEGIAEQHLSKIFDRFYQVDESRHKGGSGLGLSMAKWIIEKHGGTIRAESVLGQGTTFVISLPTRV